VSYYNDVITMMSLAFWTQSVSVQFYKLFLSQLAECQTSSKKWTSSTSIFILCEVKGRSFPTVQLTELHYLCPITV